MGLWHLSQCGLRAASNQSGLSLAWRYIHKLLLDYARDARQSCVSDASANHACWSLEHVICSVSYGHVKAFLARLGRRIVGVTLTHAHCLVNIVQVALVEPLGGLILLLFTV